ncbi:MAG: pyridoxal-dependent decarboxylase [Kangiellaceae bacterium]|nr:pyridoxal-dependent decarboxylase [Kangiellaceae bacterium]
MSQDSKALVNNLEFLSPYFLGAYGENNDVMETLLVEFVRDHIYWRRNFHPEDNPPITPHMMNSSNYAEALAKIRSELHSLTSKLKRSVPFYNPRYIGHMSSDLMMPALLAQLVTNFYNPNNITSESGPVTLNMELEVGRQFAQMFGFNTNEEIKPCAWGHLTSGGTNANYESLWNFRAAKYYPLALASAVKELQLELDLSIDNSDYKNPIDYTSWELVNFSIEEVLEFRTLCFNLVESKYSASKLEEFTQAVESNRLETRGPAQFFAENWQLKQAVVIVPSSAHYSWEKAMRVMGFGSASLVRVPLTATMRMDELELERIVNSLRSQNIPILAVIGVLGTTEFGTIDPIDKIIKIKEEQSKQGLDFYVHVDAAWGGYLTSLFRNEDGTFAEFTDMKEQFSYFPSQGIHDSFSALNHVDSITIDPHKQGYLPFGTGGFIAKNRDIVVLLSTNADYVFSQSNTPDFQQIGQYILEGSKPGANAAAAFVAHRVLPLNNQSFGRIIKQTIRSAEYFFEQLKKLKQELVGYVHLTVPFEPDSNLVTIALNPCNNTSLETMNRFSNDIYAQLTHDANAPVQSREFLGSKTLLAVNNLSKEEQTSLFKKLHLFDSSKGLNKNDKIMILRHTLMNPWLSAKNDDLNYLDKYCDYLKKIMIETVAKYKV